MRRVLAGIAAMIVLSSPAASRADGIDARLAGRWTVKFDNGVSEWCEIGKDRTASVLETRRKSAGKTDVRDGSLLVIYDDDRVERWTAIGRRAVVEHWFPATAYPHKPPVMGIAEASPSIDPDENRRPDPDGRELKGLATAKAFAAALRQQFSDETAGELRKFIDPRYLKEHQLEVGPLPIRRVVAGSIYDNSTVDSQTIFITVETKEAEKEAWLLRMTEYKGEVYILPPAPPDPKTKSFTPWTFRRQL